MVQWGVVKAARKRSRPCIRVQWELIKTLECCEIREEGIVNLHKDPVGCCESCKEWVVTLQKGSVGVVKDSRVL